MVGNEDAALELAKCNLPAARLCAEAQVLFDSNTRNEWWILGLLRVVKEAILIDLQYQDWRNSASGLWKYRLLRTASNPASCIWNNMSPTKTQTALLYIYHDIWVATVWNWYRSCRMHLHEVLLHCMTLLHSHPPARAQSIDPKETLEQSHSIISDMLSEICASVPFCIGDIDSAGKPAKIERRMPLYGYLLVWPLFVASASAESGSTQDLWIREKLEYVSNVMGIRKARLLATRIKKEPWNLK
jgi:hypothetical protein